MYTFSALRMVNKQIYEEAMPVLYNANYFHFGNLASLISCTSNVSAARLKHLTRVGIGRKLSPRDPWSRPTIDPDIIRQSLGVLARCKRLRYFELHGEKRMVPLYVSHEGWISDVSWYRGFCKIDPVACKAEEYHFRGDWTEGKQSMEDFMQAQRRLPSNIFSVG